VELRELELLVAVAETGSLGQAAQRFGLTQPAVARRVSVLERALGLRLLYRSPSGCRLTGAGAEVVAAAREVLAAAHRLVGVAERAASQSESHLRVAASFTVAEHLAPAWVAALRAELPQVSLSLEVVNSTQVMAAVTNGRVDIGFVEGPDRPLAGLASEAVTTDSLTVVVAPSHPWAGRPPVPAAELAKTELVVRERGSGTREVLEEALRPFGGVRSRLELGSSASVLAAARRGEGPAVLSALAAQAELSAGALCRVEVAGADLSRTIRAVWLAGARPSALARRLLAAAREHPAKA